MSDFKIPLDRPIKDIFKDNYCIENVPEKDRLTSTMPEWYDKLVDKSYSDLTLLDVTRMLMQNIYLDLAIEKAKELLTENQLCGEYYDGHLFEIMSRLDVSYLDKDRDFYDNLIQKAFKESDSFDWGSAEEKEEFLGFLNKLKIKISEGINE